MLKTFYIGCKGVIVSQHGALVLKKTDQNGKSFYDIPGGRVDDSETIDQTLARELKEEVPDLKEFKVVKLLNAYRLSRDLKDGNGLVLLFHKVEADLPETLQLSSEHEGYLWVTKENLDSIANSLDTYIEAGYLEAVRLALNNQNQ